MESNGLEYGDPKIARGNEILRSVVGSGVHGIAIEGTDDHDEMGIFIEPPEYAIGLRKPYEHYVFRTQPEGARSGHGDVDLVIYSLRKYLRLAVKGNPTALLPLFAPDKDIVVRTPLGDELRGLADAMLSKQAVRRFLGYMESQRQRMLGLEKKNRVPSRPELVEKYGFDVKYASHALRLAYQGLEVLDAGRLTLPMPSPQRERVLAVKSGQVPQPEVLDEIAEVARSIEARLGAGETPLPAQPDWERIGRWSVEAHRRHWQWG